jgi:thiosulfate/3-mercaptopyruvate sulfurtransferase
MMMPRTIDPVVSCTWLQSEKGKPDLKIMDIRNETEYQSGHIPGAVNIPFSAWTTTRNGLNLEIPDPADLLNIIESSGIDTASRIVIVNITGHPFPLADAARVALTLIYAGIKNTAILNGGQEKWIKEGYPLSRDKVKIQKTKYSTAVNRAILISKDEILRKIGKSLILDARDPEVYFGITLEPQATRTGHIPGAKCLPAPWIWTVEGTYKSPDELRKIAGGLFGRPGSQEIIVYCGIGGYASAWWFVLTRMLGYENVKFFDGSAQEWTRDPEMPMVMYRWE